MKNNTTTSDFGTRLKLQGFNVFQIESDMNETRVYNRKDFYKICLTTGKSIIHYADRSFETDGTVLFFANPHVPYSWETISTSYVGYTCLFSEEFYGASDRSESLQHSPLFRIGGTPILNIAPLQREFLNTIFEKMIIEQKSTYAFKDDLIRNYINLIIHEAQKLQPAENFDVQKNASFRIASIFRELLERQFPIECIDKPLQYKTAQDYANGLSIHVNHLNRAVKEVTGRSTTSHISERVIAEAKALLKHTDWGIAEVGYSLGFEYPTYFNSYFKRLTAVTPSAFRDSFAIHA
jgi:AraC family transcriptional activator of pobA